MDIKKQTTYYPDNYGDVMASVNCDGTLDLFGIDGHEWKIEDLKQLALFLNHVYSESAPIFDDSEITISIAKTDPPWPTGETMIG